MTKALLPLILALTAAFTGCKDESITTYEIHKETSKAVIPNQAPSQASGMPGMNANAMPGLAGQTSLFKEPISQAPSHWEAQELGTMRKGSWIAINSFGSAEVTILAFPGNVGGDLANINRWAGQIDMDAISLDDYYAIRESIEVGSFPGSYILLQEDKVRQSVAAAIIATEDGTWFFKIMGTKEAVLLEEPHFKAFLKTIVFRN